jgi:hypothetical protein
LTYNRKRWKTRLGLDDALQLFDMCVGQLDFERFEVSEQLLDVPASDYREHVWVDLQEIAGSTIRSDGI